MKSKIFIIPLLLIVLVGCDKNRVITQKDFNTKTPCVCNFNYIQYGNGLWFQDSCNKYNIGDTIK
jgi:hypothetical protein